MTTNKSHDAPSPGAQEAITTTLLDHPNRKARLNDLGIEFWDKYCRTRSTDDLEQTIARTQEAVEASPLDHPNQAVYLNNLGNRFEERYDRTGRIDDFDQAITYGQRAVEITARDDPSRGTNLSKLTSLFSHRWRRTGSPDDLDQTIAYAQEALRTAPPGHPDRAMYLIDLGNRISDRYNQTATKHDFDLTVECGKEAIQITAPCHPARAQYLYRLGIWMGDRYGRTGSLNDLQQAIAYAQEALLTTPSHHPNRAIYLESLANWMMDRYSRMGSSDDLNQAIAYTQEALRITSPDLPIRALYLARLGSRINARHTRTGSLDDLELAIKYGQEALQRTPLRHANRAGYLAGVWSAINRRYYRTRNMSDIDLAIAYAQEALQITRLDHPDRAGHLARLANAIGSRYYRTHHMSDLDLAIEYAQQALQITSSDHPARAEYLHDLGLLIHDRYDRDGSIEDDRNSFRLFKEASECSAAHPLSRIRSGRVAMLSLRTQRDWKAGTFIKPLIDLLPHACGRHLSRDDQQYTLSQVSGFAADACSVSLKMDNAVEALERIEYGRALILGQLMDSRSDISELALAHPDLAREYEEVRFRAFGKAEILEDNVVRESRLREQRNVPQLIEDCERRIRENPGFEHFLQPASVHELMQSAEKGPIVIVNCTDISSDAIIVFPSVIEVIPLPSMIPEPPKSFRNALEKHRAVEQRGYHRDIESDIPQQYDADFLSWLWSTCVSPVLQKVADCRTGREKDEIPRVWWIGTGAASSLPFHAAGNHGSGALDGSDNCLLRCISSYAPSIKSLKHARMTATRASKLFVEDRSLLVITMPTTPGQGALAGASLEKEAIQGAVGQRWALKSLACPTTLQVLKEIKIANIVHFACHGSSDPVDPMKSHLLLQKEDGRKKTVDKLTVSDLLDAAVQPRAWIAYLSACSTAEVKAQRLADESLHLTSAFQMAGFTHVIGSLRPADDQSCVQVAKLFYSYLLGNKDSMDLNRVVPEALNYAVRQISKEHPKDSRLWAPFIHLGA